jgi:hypothetical protein
LKARSERFCFILVFLIASIGFAVNFVGHHDLIGGADEGSYLAMGKLFSEGKGFVFLDPVANESSRFTDPNYFLPWPFFASDGYVMTPWSKGYPIVTSLFWRAYGYAAFTAANPLFSSISAILMFLICRRLGSPWGGVAASALLETSWLELWYSRYPMSEMLSQLLFLATTYVVLQYYRKPADHWMVAIGGLLSLAVLTHFENIPVVVEACAVVGYVLSKRLRDKASIIQKARSTAIFASALVVAPLLTFLIISRVDPSVAAHYTYYIPRVYSGAVGIGSGFSSINRLLATCLYILVMFVPVPIVLFAMFSMSILILKSRERVVWLVLGMVALIIAYGFVTTAINPHPIYNGRRLIWSIIPVLYLAVGVFGQRILSYFPQAKMTGVRRIALKGLIVCMIILAITAQITMYLPFQGINKGQGFPSLAAKTQQTLTERGSISNSIVIIGATGPIFDSGIRYVYGILIVSSARAPTSVLTSVIIPHELGQNRSVYLLDDSLSGDLLLSIERAGYHCIELWNYSSSWNDPNGVGTYEWPTTSTATITYTLYALSA